MKLMGAATAVVAMAVISGCTQQADPAMPPVPTLAPPTPAGMELLPPEAPQVPDPAANACDRTASLRPFAGRIGALERSFVPSTRSNRSRGYRRCQR